MALSGRKAGSSGPVQGLWVWHCGTAVFAAARNSGIPHQCRLQSSVLLQIQLPTSASGKAVEYGQGASALATHGGETQMHFLAPGLSVAQP